MYCSGIGPIKKPLHMVDLCFGLQWPPLKTATANLNRTGIENKHRSDEEIRNKEVQKSEVRKFSHHLNST